MNTLCSPGDLMQRFKLNRNQLRYVTELAGVKPAQRIGNAGAFDAAGVAAIDKKLADIRGRRNGRVK